MTQDDHIGPPVALDRRSGRERPSGYLTWTCFFPEPYAALCERMRMARMKIRLMVMMIIIMISEMAAAFERRRTPDPSW